MIEEFLRELEGKVRFDCPQLAFCTHYSWFGIAKRESLGLEELWLFYNRRPALLSPRFLTFRTASADGDSDRQSSQENAPLEIRETDGRGFRTSTSFLDTDILICSIQLDEGSPMAEVTATLHIPRTDPSFDRQVVWSPESRILCIRTSTPASDPRDPDPHHPLTVCVRVPEAFRIAQQPDTAVADVNIEFTASADDLASGASSFVVGIGEGPTADIIEERMPSGDPGADAPRENSLRWLRDGLGEFTFEGVDPRLKLHYAKAAYQILCNTKAPRGQLRRLAAYPNRGTYCAHYLWDACFTSLGTSHFNRSLAEDYLLGVVENAEPDGKIPQFVCATWNRPGESQPPLIAWAAWRLYRQTGNGDFLTRLYEPLCRMVDWWFEQRDADRDGVVEYQHRLESGWDNSQRFERGRIAAVDLNAYLNREMRVISKIANVLGRDREAVHWNQWAADHARRMHERLYDPEDQIFYDRLVEENVLNKILTPACFMPLWTGMRIPIETVRVMIAQHLLNPREFFGARPFPVIAYSHPTYDSEDWWRGPVWPNIAWAMCEVLRIYGYAQQHDEAARRLLSMMVSSDELNELYSSATGEPLGAPGLDWGCSIFMELAKPRPADD